MRKCAAVEWKYIRGEGYVNVCTMIYNTHTLACERVCHGADPLQLCHDGGGAGHEVGIFSISDENDFNMIFPSKHSTLGEKYLHSYTYFPIRTVRTTN